VDLPGAVVIIAAVIFSVCALPLRAANSRHLTTSVPVISSVVVEGSTAYSPPQLFAVYRDQLGRPLARESAQAVSAALIDLYSRDGFVKPVVEPDGALGAHGVLRLEVHEAEITRVVFEGDAGRFDGALRRIAAQLESSRPLRREDVPRALRRMREISGLSVTASTRRSAGRNAFELVVKSDFSPIDGVVRANNRGTSQVGPNFLLGQVFANGLLGRHEKIGLIFAAATDHEEYLGGGLYFDAPLGGSGTRGNALLFRSRSAPNEAPVNYDDVYVRERATLRVSRPLRQDSQMSLVSALGVEADELVIERAGTQIRHDRLRIVEGALRSHWRGAGGMQYSANLQLRKGMDAFGAGLDARDLPVDRRREDFLVTQLQSSAYRRFADRWSVRLDAFLQHSGYVLPDSERFKIGGDRLGRGFEVAEIAGDKGIGGKLELRRDLMITESLIGRLSAYGFYDIGAAWKQDRAGRDSAATAGTGLALQGSRLTGYVEVAAPITGADIEGSRAASIFAELSYRF
jgi:hemolysin activation/secretion protein